MADFETILFEVHDRVATITLNRPERKNAMNQQLKDELRACWQRVKADPDIWVAIITGAGTGIGREAVPDRPVDRLGARYAQRQQGQHLHPDAQPDIHPRRGRQLRGRDH